MQCVEVDHCNLGCGCTIADTASATFVNNYFQSLDLLRFEGDLLFEIGTTVHVECNATVPPGRHVGGYALSLVGKDRSMACPVTPPEIATDDTSLSKWGCAIALLLQDEPLEAGDVFEQSFATSDAAAGARGTSIAWLARSLAAATMVVVAASVQRRSQ